MIVLRTAGTTGRSSRVLTGAGAESLVEVNLTGNDIISERGQSLIDEVVRKRNNGFELAVPILDPFPQTIVLVTVRVWLLHLAFLSHGQFTSRGSLNVERQLTFT